MPVERHLLGWDAPVTAKVREFLMPPDPSVPVDLENQLVVVPTRQAGRRLREALALHCAERDTALLSPRVVTPTFFFQPGDEPGSVACQTEVTAAWAGVLMGADLSEYKGLFPGQAPARDFAWALRTGGAIQRLRRTLVDGGYRIGDVHREFGGVLEEPDRWRDLAALERACLDRLDGCGRRDPVDLMIGRSEKPEMPGGIERIVVAAVPDPTPLMVRALERLSERVPVVILVHAPGSMEDRFDGWGRPITEKWREYSIDVPGPWKNIILAGSPSSHGGRVLELIAAESGRFGPADIAVGVPDGGVTPFLSSRLAEEGLPAFDPSGKSLNEHPLYGLIESFRGLVCEGTYAAAAAFLRNADVLSCLERVRGLQSRAVLKGLDEFRKEYLPADLEDITRRLPAGDGGEGRGRSGSLGGAAAFALEQVEAFGKKDIESAVRSFLQTVYADRVVSPGVPADEEFREVAKLVDDALRELGMVFDGDPGIAKEDGLDLLLERLRPQSYYPERADAVIDLEGWLELPWNDAPFLIVTGMNDGFVPDGRLSDIFLPDSLRGQLGLRCDADRLARDSYLMSGLIESRRTDGRVCFIAGKTSAPGNPLKPSRLLFRCGDGELPPRALRLFGDPDEERPNCPSTVSFKLDARPPADLPAGRLDIVKMQVTRFRDYLACPFRFYLKHVLGMEELDDVEAEMDARDFGAMVHHALNAMAKDDAMRACADERRLRAFLCAGAEQWVERRFGRSPLLPVLIQLESARQRLGAAARVQAALAGDGWEILHSEMMVEARLGGMLVVGRIDRIDRHRGTGRLRILDYKTSDNAEEPAKVHLGAPAPHAAGYMQLTVKGREKRWIDLQLPLYRMLLAGSEEIAGPVELGYFDMPKAVNDTGVTTWDGFNEELLESAVACARGVAGDVRNRRFWPPAEKVRYDDFESLFHDDIAKCIDADAFTAFLKESIKK